MIGAILLALTTVTVQEGGWGDASVTDIQNLLNNVQQNFFAAFPQPPTGEVCVQHGTGSPLIANRQSSRETARIFLDVSGRHWAQFAYQFAHELCHHACDHDRFKSEDDKPHPWMWFQESLCETASLFTLRRMAESWKTKPPYPNWTDYVLHLHEYEQKLIDEPARKLPDGVCLADWYAANRVILANNSTIRPLNNVVANRLLPLFEANPRGWQAVRTLPATHGTLAEYFQMWLAQTPREHAAIIRAIAREFQVPL